MNNLETVLSLGEISNGKGRANFRSEKFRGAVGVGRKTLSKLAIQVATTTLSNNRRQL